jgi:hypothetical protein
MHWLTYLEPEAVILEPLKHYKLKHLLPSAQFCGEHMQDGNDSQHEEQTMKSIQVQQNNFQCRNKIGVEI